MTPDKAELNPMQVALEANALAYRRVLQASAPGDCWDFVILTAANEPQAQRYRQELALRQQSAQPAGAFFPAIQRCLVVADPVGRRIGSGGATFAALRQLVSQFNIKPENLDHLRILMIHSGGASRRLPAYSALGKIFAPLPLLRPDGQIATFFDHLYVTLAGLPERLGPGMLVVAGDVFLLFDHRHVSTPTPGITAFSMRVEADQVGNHGVFKARGDGRIDSIIHQASTDGLHQQGAIDEQGRVLLDTGLLFFDVPRTKGMMQLAGCFSQRRGIDQRCSTSIDLYEDLTAALAFGTNKKQFLSNRPALRRVLWQSLHGQSFRTHTLAGQSLHVATTRQFRDAMVGKTTSPAAELFQHDVLAHCQWPIEQGRRIFHSALLANGKRTGTLGAGSVVEHSILCAGSQIGAGSIVSQVASIRRPVKMGDQRLMFQVPIRTADQQLAYVHVVCGIEDDFKGRFVDGECSYLNQPIDLWLGRCRIRATEIWGGIAPAQRTLWNARLFVITASRDDAADVALPLSGDTPPTKKQLTAWRKSRRYSMAMLLEAADPLALIAYREMVAAYLQTPEVIDSIQRHQDRPVDSLLSHYSTAQAYQSVQELLEQFAAIAPANPQQAIDQSRALWTFVQLLQRPDFPNPIDARLRIDEFARISFAKIAEASELGYSRIEIQNPKSKIQNIISPGLQVEAASPVRLDLAGGWSDTPPYCFERGGHVVNVAIDLDGRPPVRATVRSLKEPKLLLQSHDLGKQVELQSIDPAIDVRDPFALIKVALGITGLLPDKGSLSHHLKQLGAGLYISTECRVPKGSGLGTSSILAATLLAALHKIQGRDASPNQLIEQTLLLEQRLSTGGGWQDQIGGIIGGVKSTTTALGVPQKPCVERLNLSDAQYQGLEDRLVVYFSGQQRLARDILRRVVGRWIAREPNAVLLQRDLIRSAATLREALMKNQWSSVAREIARYWQIKKELYPGSTTPGIDVLFLEMQEHCLAAGLAGAGGGGFGYFFCRDGKQARKLRELLANYSARPGSLGSVYSTQINRKGLSLRCTRG